MPAGELYDYAFFGGDRESESEREVMFVEMIVFDHLSGSLRMVQLTNQTETG